VPVSRANAGPSMARESARPGGRAAPLASRNIAAQHVGPAYRMEPARRSPHGCTTRSVPPGTDRRSRGAPSRVREGPHVRRDLLDGPASWTAWRPTVPLAVPAQAGGSAHQPRGAAWLGASPWRFAQVVHPPRAIGWLIDWRWSTAISVRDKGTAIGRTRHRAITQLT
jgi:hypothetical protein